MNSSIDTLRHDREQPQKNKDAIIHQRFYIDKGKVDLFFFQKNKNKQKITNLISGSCFQYSKPENKLCIVKYVFKIWLNDYGKITVR